MGDWEWARRREGELVGRGKRSRPLSNMGPTLSGQTSIFGVVFSVSSSLEEIEKRKSRSQVRILIFII